MKRARKMTQKPLKRKMFAVSVTQERDLWTHGQQSMVTLYPRRIMAVNSRGRVGRQAELAQLSRVLTEKAERAAVVCGEPEAGKTALIEQRCSSAASGGWQVVRLKTSLAGLDERDQTVLAPVLGGDPESAVSALPLSGLHQIAPRLRSGSRCHRFNGVHRNSASRGLTAAIPTNRYRARSPGKSLSFPRSPAKTE